MNEFLKMDVFFAVTTVVVLIVGGLVAYVLWWVSKILKHIEHVSEQVSLETDSIRADLRELRVDIAQGKSKLQSFLKLFGTIHKRRDKKSDTV